MAFRVIYYVSNALAEIVYVVEPREHTLIKTKVEIHKKPFGIVMHSIFLFPLPYNCMYMNSKFYFLFEKLQAYVHVQYLGSLFVISVDSILPCVCT